MTLQELINTATDVELIEAGIGCINQSYDGEYGYCKYCEKTRCTKGAFLTSTLPGAHPNDCPLYREKGEK